jgi:adenylate cyclase
METPAPRILIVDDTPQNIQVLGTLLRKEAYQINVAQNGLQALGIIEQVKPDLILLDIMMPEMDGFETCKHLKANDETKDIPIIFLTAKVELEDVIHGLELGAVDYVTKPFNATELLRRVESHLELKFSREKLAGLADQLSRYLSPYVYASIFEGRQNAAIEAEMKELTVFFSDIAGFTPLSESMEPAELTTWLNQYLHTMAEITIKHGGTLDKFEGDAVMVFFGDPETEGREQDAVKCVQMAQEMQEAAKQLDISVRMGICSGPCTVGNFGSVHHMDYTIIGRVVNTAARLESHSEPGRILVSDSTQALIANQVSCEERGGIRVKGIDRDLMTYWVNQ